MELTITEYYGMLELLPTRKSDDYWLDLTKQAWLAQYIGGMLGGKSKVYEEMIKNDPSKEREKGGNKNSSSNSSMESWREQAEKRGLKYKS